MTQAPEHPVADPLGSGYSTILNALDALVYVADMQSHAMIFVNQYGRDRWGDPVGRPCWQVLQADRTGPCDFCTNSRLLDEAGNPAGVHVWEFQNTVNGRWYQCRDQAIRWTDGRLVRLEIASDITERKAAEEAAKAATARAERLASIDELTGVRNRRALFEESIRIFNLAKRFNHAMSVIMMDLDYFKQVNDRYGHPAGDAALVSLALTVSRNIREVDIFGRIGGEEFALILPETALPEGVEVASKLRRAISQLVIDAGSHQFGISCSFGIAGYCGERNSFNELLADADKALYRAKESGRNRIECYSVG